MAEPLRLNGYTQTLRAINELPRAVAKGLRAELRHVGESIRAETAADFAETSPETASGFRTYVRLRGVSVEQSDRKTTGLRPDWGVKQQRDLIDNLDDKQDELVADVAVMVERVAAVLGL